MADKARNLTDKKLEQMEKHLSAIYRRAEKEIQKTADEYFLKFDEQDKKKLKAVKDGKMTEEQYKQWRKNKLMYGKRFTALKENIAEQLLNINKTAVAYINGELPEIYTINYNALADTESVDIGGYSFTLTDSNTVKKLATSDKTLLPYKIVDGKKDVRWNTKKVNAEVLHGIIQGESMQKIANRLQNVTEMNRTSAIRNARTTVTSAENKGRFDSYIQAESDGLILQKEWIATNDKRTRHSHAILDGETIDTDKKFSNGLMYPADPNGIPSEVYNCRCAMGTVVVGFKKAQVQKAMAEKQVEAPKPQEWDNLPDNVTDRATAIDKLLTEETGKKSVFNGKVVIDDSIKFNGTANYNGSITLRSNASRKTEIHELLHQHSEGGQNKVYVAVFKNIEEGSVELLAQEICHAKGIKIGQFDYSYTPYVDALRQINKLSGAYKTDYDFAKAVFDKPLEKRAEYLKSLGDGVAKAEKRFFRGALKTLGVK